jgi:hypothetical protein
MSSSQNAPNDPNAGQSSTDPAAGASGINQSAGPTQDQDNDQPFSAQDRIDYNLREDALGRRDARVLLTGNADVERGEGTSLRGTLMGLAFDASRELHAVGDNINRRRRAMLLEIVKMNESYTDEQLVTFVQTVRQNRG